MDKFLCVMGFITVLLGIFLMFSAIYEIERSFEYDLTNISWPAKPQYVDDNNITWNWQTKSISFQPTPKFMRWFRTPKAIIHTNFKDKDNNRVLYPMVNYKLRLRTNR